MERTIFINMDDLIFNPEIIIMIVFGMLVPTGDNYSDIWLSYTYFSGTYVPVGKYVYIWNETLSLAEKVQIVPIQQPIYGWMTLLPVLVSFLITAIHWYQTEKSPNRCWTVPLLLTQIWPQYRTARILWLYKKGDLKCKKEKDQVEKELSAIGKFNCFEFFTYFLRKLMSVLPLWVKNYHGDRRSCQRLAAKNLSHLQLGSLAISLGSVNP